jgi:hypothetical protein
MEFLETDNRILVWMGAGILRSVHLEDAEGLQLSLLPGAYLCMALYTKCRTSSS